MKKKIIPFLAMSALTFGMLSTTLVGCQAEPVKGDKGDKGDKGEDGKTPEVKIGENGNWFINGVDTGVKASGNDGEDGKDGKTPEVKIGTNGNWFINGVDTGIKASGSDGENGTDGEKGDTAWSNTIIPTSGGYITPSVGSAVSGEKISFKITPLAGNGLATFTVNDKDVSSNVKFDETTKTYIYETIMEDNGFVVCGTFEELTKAEGYTYIDGVAYENTLSDRNGNIFDKGKKVEGEHAPDFAGGSGTKEDPLVIASSEQFTSENLTNSNSSYFTIQEDLTLTGTIPMVEGEQKETHIDLNGKELTVDHVPGKTSTQVLGGDTLTLSNGTLTGNNLGQASFIGLGDHKDKEGEGGKLVLDNVTIDTTSNISASGVLIANKNSTFEMNNSTINTGGFAFSTNASLGSVENVKITIKDSTLNSLATTNRDNVGLLINIPATTYVANSTISGGRQAVIIRSGSATIENSTIQYNTDYYHNPTDDEGYKGPYYDGSEWKDGNRVPTAAIVVGDNNKGAYKDPAKLYLNNVKYEEVKTTAPTPTTRSATTLPENPYKIFAYGESEELYALLDMDDATYEQFKGGIKANEFTRIDPPMSMKTKEYVLEGTTIYKEAVYDKDNSLVSELSKEVTSFDGGNNTKENPLLVSNREQLEAISLLQDAGDLYIKLTNEEPIKLLNQLVVNLNNHLHLDLNGKILDIDETVKASDRTGLSIMINVYGEFTLDDSTATEENKAGKGAIKGGRNVITLQENSKATFNAGTITNISKSGGSAIDAYYKGVELTINYVEVYCTNYALSSDGKSTTINDGKFVNVTSVELDLGYCYVLNLVGENTVINKAEVLGIHGGIYFGGPQGIINEGVKSRIDHQLAIDTYKAKFKELEETTPITDEEFSQITDEKAHYALYVSGEDNEASVTINGGTYIAESKAALYIGNRNDGGEGHKAFVTINDGYFESLNEKAAAITWTGIQGAYGDGGVLIHKIKLDKTDANKEAIYKYLGEAKDYQIIETFDSYTLITGTKE